MTNSINDFLRYSPLIAKDKAWWLVQLLYLISEGTMFFFALNLIAMGIDGDSILLLIKTATNATFVVMIKAQAALLNF